MKITEHKHFKTVLKIITLIILISLAGTAGYFYGKSLAPSKTESVDSSKNAMPNPTPTPTFHTVMSQGSTFGANLLITTNLGVPNNLQAIVSDTTIQSPGYTTLLANKFNADMGRWVFGRPNIPDDNGAGQLSLIHIEDSWLNSSGDPNADDRQDQILGLDLTATSSQKKSFITTLATDTKACSTDPAKGFTIDNKLYVCYTAQHTPQSVETYEPIMTIKGYGQIEGRGFVMAGYLNLNENNDYTGAQKDEFTKQFRAGNIPTHTKATMTKYIDALKHTTISAKEIARS